MTANSPAVRMEKRGPVFTVILSRPEVRNAVDSATAKALTDAFRSFDSDPESRAAVFFGDHGTFCAGRRIILDTFLNDLITETVPSVDPSSRQMIWSHTDDRDSKALRIRDSPFQDWIRPKIGPLLTPRER